MAGVSPGVDLGLDDLTPDSIEYFMDIFSLYNLRAVLALLQIYRRDDREATYLSPPSNLYTGTSF
jgi:hypothetical protein